MINDYNEERECDYKEEHYSVRDNGAIMRHLREGKKTRKDDGVWTFGKKNEQTGYMLLGQHRVHIIVATAFYGAHDSTKFVVDHKDTNRCNNRIENLHWLTKLENAINNPITRAKIIYLCGSLDAFIENPNILREKLSQVKEPSLEWMRTVTKEEAANAHANLQRYWAEQAKNPQPLKGGKLNESIYQPQLELFEEKKPIITKKVEPSNDPHIDREYMVDDAGWEKLINPIKNSEKNRQDVIAEEKPQVQNEIKYNLAMSLTPNAAHSYGNDPCYYPSTPQGEYTDPLQAYADALKEGAVFWRHRNGKREYTVISCRFSEDRKALYVKSIPTYGWKEIDGEMTEVLISDLTEEEMKNVHYSTPQLNEITYTNGLYIHKRLTTGFLPPEYVDQIENDYK